MDASTTLATLTVLGYGWGGAYPLVTPARTIPVQFACGTSDGFFGYAEQSEAYLASQGHDTRLEAVSGVGHSFSGILGGVPAEDLRDWMVARPL